MGYREGPMYYLRAQEANNMLRSVFDEYDQPWIIAMDVAEIFGMRTDHLVRIVRPKDKTKFDLRNTAHLTSPIRNTPHSTGVIRGRGNLSSIWAITPRGMGRIVARSRHPLAEDIHDWLYEEVFPELFTTGRYFVDKNEWDAVQCVIQELKEENEILRSEIRTFWEHNDVRLRDFVERDD